MSESKYVFEDGSVNEVAIAYELLAILQAYAPNGVAQEGVSRGFNRMRADGNSWTVTTSALAGMLQDGLRHGNWPWTGIMAERKE